MRPPDEAALVAAAEHERVQCVEEDHPGKQQSNQESDGRQEAAENDLLPAGDRESFAGSIRCTGWLDRGVVGVALHAVVGWRGSVKRMHDAVHHRGKNDTRNRYDCEATIESIESLEELARSAAIVLERAHAAEKHRRVEKGVNPAQTFEYVKADHSEGERDRHGQKTDRDARGQATNELGAAQDGLRSMLEHVSPTA